MNVTQIYNLVNTAVKEICGESIIVNNDLSNLVDVGNNISNSVGFDSFYKSLVNVIGKTYFVDRIYKSVLPTVFKDAWEYGSIVRKVQADDMPVNVNDTWSIVNGASYDPYVVNLPNVEETFFNKMATFQLDITIPLVQIEQSFHNLEEMDRFLTMIQTMVANSLESSVESTVLMCIANFIAAVVNANGASTIHLVTEYNTNYGASLTSSNCIYNADFLRYATERMTLVKAQLARRTSIFNLKKKRRHTPSKDLHVVVLANVASACKAFMQSGTYHKELVELPNYEEVAYWQGVGTAFALADASAIDVTFTKPDNTTDTLSQAYIAAVMFDNDALGMLQPRKRVKAKQGENIDVMFEYHKWESRYFNSFDENFVVFLLN